MDKGWRASWLAELEMGRVRPGLEVFAKGVRSESTRVQAGPGVIWDLGPLDVRLGIHVGLSRAAPDLAISLWVTSKWSLW